MALLRTFPTCRYSLVTLLVLIAIAPFSSGQELPKGWTVPAASSTRQAFRQKDRNRFLVATGDFNGDGKQDKAVLLVNKATSKLGFFCLPHDDDWLRLATSRRDGHCIP